MSLKDFFKKKNRRIRRGPVKTMCTYRGPAVNPSTTATYYIQRTIPLVIVLGAQYNTTGPAVNKADNPANDNTE